MKLDRPKIIVTGGAGFIGSHTVVALVENGFEPIIIDDFSNASHSVLDGLYKIIGRQIKCYEMNCCRAEQLEDILQKEGDIKGIIHFAAFKSVSESQQYPLKYYENNVLSLGSVLRVMNKLNIKHLVFSSSCTVYGEPDQVPVTESSSIKEAASVYGYTKQIGERMIGDTINASKGLQAVILRYFNPIGAHPSAHIGELPNGVPENLVPYITQTAIGLRKQLTVFGGDYPTPDGTAIRDYIHVMDLAMAHVKALDWLKRNDERQGIFNIGTGKGTSVMELLSSFERINQVKVNYQIGPRRPGDIEQIYAQCDKSNNVMDWEAHFTIEEALRDAWNWEKKFRESN